MSESPPSSTREESLLDAYFTSLATFSQDRARDTVEKEREVGCRGAVGGRVAGVASFCQLLPPLAQLAGGEKQYHSGAFLQPRGFLRSDRSLRQVYENIKNDVLRVRDGCPRGDILGELTGIVSVGVSQLCLSRLHLMDVYERLCNLSSKPLPYRDIISSVETVSGLCADLTPGPMTAWLEVFQLEVDILNNFLQAAANMQTWRFFESLMLVQSGSERMGRWAEIIKERETKKLGLMDSLLRGVGGTAEPHLYLWFQKLKSALLSKFSLYFHNTLAGQTTQAEMKALTGKLAIDHQSRMTAFQRRVDATAVCVVFDATNLDQFHGPGYHHQDNQQAHLAGLDLYPPVFSYPVHPKDHWPNIVMTLTDRATELSQYDRVVHLFDSGVGSTYYLAMIEPRFTLVVVFEGRRGEKDSAVNTFMQETVPQLRCTKVFAGLKPGVK